VPVMKKQRSGHILNVASAAAFASGPRMSAYNVAKAGVVALSETLKAELYDDHVNVSILMPTFIRTNLGIDCLGTPDNQELARSIVDKSPVSAEQAVNEVLLAVQENTLYIVLPASARTIWRIKRFLPENFWYLTRFELKRQQFVAGKKPTKLTANDA
jgi:short-subunit dehydrogenase